MSQLIRVNNKYNTEQEWLDARLDYLNGSEIGAMMMLSPYKSRLQLYLEKIGEKKVAPFDNMKTFMGRYLESQIANLWKYWGGDEETLRMNHTTGKVVRKCRRMNCSVINPNIPYICCSVDRVISHIDDKKKKGILEIKNTNNFAASMWENGIDPTHIVQLQTYLLTFGYDYGELAVLKDGNKMDVYVFDAQPNIQQNIIEHAQAFWEKVSRGKVLYRELQKAKAENDKIKIRDYSEMLQSNEPDPEGTKAYDDFLTERYKSNDDIITLNRDNKKYLSHAIEYSKINNNIKLLNEEKLKHSSEIKAYMKEYGIFDMSPYGKITWKNTQKGTRAFYVNINKEYTN